MIMCTQVVDNPEELGNFYSPQLPESQFCQSCILKIPHANRRFKNTDNSVHRQPETETSTLSNASSNTSRNNQINGIKSASKSTLTLEDQISTLLTNSPSSPPQRRLPMTMKSQSQQNQETHFISTQFPTNTEIYSSLRQIIVRVFTAETNSDSSKPIMFGNSKHGYSIALSFSLMDKTARGSERKYSIIVTSNWEADIFNNYTFILTNLNQVVSNILRKARKVQKQCNFSTDEIHNNDSYLRRSAGLPKAKSMIEILQDENFFLKIHTWASFMLEALENNRQMG